MGGGEDTGGRREDDVKALPKGVYYKVQAEGAVTGAVPKPGIPSGSTLIFDIELLAINRINSNFSLITRRNVMPRLVMRLDFIPNFIT